jgi:hypothetical protein
MSSAECKIGPDCNLEECGCEKCMKMYYISLRIRDSINKTIDNIAMEILKKNKTDK